ncbi:MAG: zinc ribbon domain-containing protein [Methanomassiliicoccales archaeon]|nr:zinc ribbon domain-containing protein [Methanomassiliicoccales archaeon]
MALDFWIPIVVWLALGAAIALYLYRYMDKEGKVEIAWVIIGFLLSVLGLLAFIGLRAMKERDRDKAVDPKSYHPPEYKMKGSEEGAAKTEKPKAAEPKPETAPKKVVKQIEGIPRCPSCGAAISSVDKKCADCGAKLKD